MVEPLMFFGIGFLVAALFGLIFIPLVHARAVRLTMRRLEASTPLSMAEIQADKDQLRAEFAMSTRRLEMSVEQLKARTTSQLAELGKKSDAINRLKVELGEKTASIFALEAHEKALKDQLRATEEELSVKIGDLREADRTVADQKAELAKLMADLDERSVVIDSQRIELVALHTQVDMLKDRVGESEKKLKATEDQLKRERIDANETIEILAFERGKVENLTNRVADLERRLVAQSTEAEILGRRAQELDAQLAIQGRLLAQRDYQCEQLNSQLEAARKSEADLRTELGEIGGRLLSEHDNLKAEKAAAEQQLDQIREERAKLQREIASMKRDTESSWASERVENALLRERINDVAAEVARLTAALEGPGSLIETILTEDANRTHLIGAGIVPEADAGAGPAEGEMSESKGGNLAARIRALQSRASRLTPPKPN